MILTKRDLQEWLREERKKYMGDSSCFIYWLRLWGGFEGAVIWNFQKRLRITEYHLNAGNKIRYTISRILLNHKMNKTGLHIFPNICGKGLKIMHLGPVLMNGRVKIGENVTIHIMTSFVAGGTNHDTPVIGNDVIIGVGATVLGGVKIADGMAVGANAVVNKSFNEKNIAIAGIPARKISDHGSRTWGGGMLGRDSHIDHNSFFANTR